MATEQTKALGERMGFDEWREPRPGDGERLFVWRFALGGGELPGWRVHRVDRPPPGEVVTLQSIWTGVGGGDELLRVDTFECPSAAAARETMLRVLGDYQGAHALRRGDGPGEVGFAMPNGHAELFARGNLVVQVRNAGRRLVAVREHAARLDDWLLMRPPVEPAGITMREETVEPDRVAELASRLETAEAAWEGRPRAFLKLFVRGGEVVREKGRLAFRGDAAAGAVAAYVVEPVVPPGSGSERSGPGA
jgi:hypothetical protein